MQDLFDALLREYGAAGVIIAVVAILLRKEIGNMITGNTSDPTTKILGRMETKMGAIETAVKSEGEELRKTIIKMDQNLVRANYLLETIKDELQRN